MKTKLLRELRETAANRIYIYFDRSAKKYLILFDANAVTGLIEYDGTPSEYFKILDKSDSLKEIRNMCNFYRREYILLKVTGIRNKEHRW